MNKQQLSANSIRSKIGASEYKDCFLGFGFPKALFFEKE